MATELTKIHPIEYFQFNVNVQQDKDVWITENVSNKTFTFRGTRLTVAFLHHCLGTMWNMASEVTEQLTTNGVPSETIFIHGYFYETTDNFFKFDLTILSPDIDESNLPVSVNFPPIGRMTRSYKDAAWMLES
jgi:hypothetical protein